MASGLGPKQKSAIKAAFKKYDTDGNGHVCAGELVSAMKDIGVHIGLDSARRMISAYDKDNSETLELDEFEAIIANRAKVCYESEIRQAFAKLDKDGCGTITTGQLAEAIGKEESLHLTPDQIEQMVKEADINQDGLINYEEFLNMMEPVTDDQS